MNLLYKYIFVLYLSIIAFSTIWIVLLIAIILTRIWYPSILQRLANLLLRNEVEDQVLSKILEDIKSVADETTAAGIEVKDEVQLPWNSSLSSSSIRYFHRRRKTTVIGMDHHLIKIKDRLEYGSSKLEVVPIVGIGGIGKTTLATHVYQDSSICGCFYIRAWATVSQESCFRQVVLDLLKSAKLVKNHMEGHHDNEMLGQHLYESMQGIRYLIVMDDVWDVKIWDDVKRFLPHDDNGSRVLITTQLMEVARYANSVTPLHRMNFLKVHDSQRLLNDTVFGGENCPKELRKIRDEIARLCKGLPLALVVIGGLLSKVARKEEDWRSVVKSLKSIDTKNDECLEILALSYYHLPHHLRPCFLYMGMFPKDYLVPVVKLVRLWTAEGFLQRSDLFISPEKSPENLAEEYLDDLVQRHLILVSTVSSQGKIKRCKIHDILRKLCLREARKDRFLFVINRQQDVRKGGIESYRRLIIRPEILKTCPDILHGKVHRNSRIHSLLLVGTNHNPLEDNTINYLHYRLLRVLDLLIIHLPMFPLEVSNILGLRYLALSFTGMLHPHISRLQNLQTIIHEDKLSQKDYMLPAEIWMIPTLTHILVPAIGLLVPPPLTLSSDSSSGSSIHPILQTLAEVINLSFSYEILHLMRFLKKLVLSYDVELQSFRGWLDHELQNLANLHRLENIKLSVTNLSTLTVIGYPWNLAIPGSLKKLTLSGCRIPWEYLIRIGKLPNLEVLKLRCNACQGEIWESIKEQFSGLKYLKLEDMDLVHWRADNTHFPCLQHLIVKSCDQLEEIPLDIGYIPTLQRIELVNCHLRIVTSVEKIRELRNNAGNSEFEASVC